MRYLLDANVFRAANNLHDGLDFCPASRDWLIEGNAQQKVFSIEKVGDEISAGDDALAGWTEGPGKHLFLKPDSEPMKGVGQVGKWVTERGYSSAAVNSFLQVADCWLIARALVCRLVVVTHEKLADTPNKVKIPDVCVGKGVKVMTPFEMLRHERARFVLGGAA